MSSESIHIKLKVWRQKSKEDKGQFEVYDVRNISTHASFLEMLDVLNDQLSIEGKEPIAFDHDCREGICGSCGAMVNGNAHGPIKGITLCQLHMRSFNDGDMIVLEPFRSRSLPVLKDLIIDRTAFDTIVESGGYISVKTGSAPDAHAIPIEKKNADESFNAAACIGCTACVASCPNASASLFVAAQISKYALLPQGDAERKKRVKSMVKTMDQNGFGNCSNAYQCEAACPKEISVTHIARMNRELLAASFSL